MSVSGNAVNTNIGIINAQNQAAAGGQPTIYTATLKGKINGLEETVNVLIEELNFYKNEIGNLQQEKVELEESLARKTHEIRTTLVAEVKASDESMKQQYQAQKAENMRTAQAITTLKAEKTNLNQHLLDLKRRVAELELTIGDDQK